MKWKDKNFGKHPSDPEYDDGYDAKEDYDRYLDAVDEKYQFEKENR